MKLTSAPLVLLTTGNSVAVPTDTHTLGVNGVGVSVTTVGASTTYQVQYTLDDPWSAAGIVNWLTPAAGQFTGTLSGTTAAAGTYVGNINVFCTAVRLSVTVITTSASIMVWQADNTLGA